MEFAAAPLQVLLSENARADQLESFLKQLTEQFQALNSDEKDRFGSLQILLPTLRAYVTASQPEDAGKCLSTYLTPLMNMSLSNDSMVAAESVRLLSDDVAYWMSHVPDFGRSTLIQLLGQILYVMETELDFVDLQPIRYIETWVQNAEWKELCSHLQQQIKVLQPTRVQPAIHDEDTDDSASLATFNTNSTSTSSVRSAPGILDIECCLDVMNRFVQELPDGKSSQGFSGWIDVIMGVSVAMFACTDASVRRKVTSELVLSLFAWQREQEHENGVEKRNQWCRMLWDRTLAIYKLPATNLLRSEAYGLTAKFFDLYFNSDNGAPALDLRFDEEFFRILQSGLRSNDGLYRKYSSYILKRTIDYTTQHPDSNGKKWTKYFEWSADKSRVYADQWADWFLLYDIMHESVIHLVEPVLPRFEPLLVSEAAPLDASWWICLFYRGFQNDTASVKKGILEYIFGLENVKCLNILGSEREFIFGALFKSIDLTSLYTVPTQGTLVSPFGEKLRSFTRHLVEAFYDKEYKAQFLKELIHHLAHVVSSSVPIYYIMEALAETEVYPVWGSDELKSMRFLVDKHRNFHGGKARLFLRKLAIPATANFLDPSMLSFSDVAKTISSLTTDYPLESMSDAYQCLQSLMQRIAQKNPALADSLKCLKERTDTYVNDASAEEYATASSLCNQAFVIARSSVFIVSSADHKEPDQAKTRLLFESLILKLKNPTSNSTATLNRSLVLFHAVSETFKLCFSKETDLAAVLGLNDLDTLLRLVTRQYLDLEKETDEDMIQVLLVVTLLLLESTSLTDEVRTSKLQTYYHEAIETMQGEAKSRPCKVSIAQIPCIQFIKILYQIALKHEYYELPCDANIATQISGLVLKKTSDVSRSTRKWGDIVSLFIRCKWECMHSLANYALAITKNGLQIETFSASDVFPEAVDQLENATEACAEAIIECTADVIALPGDKEEELINAAVDYVIELIKENLNQSRTSPGIMRAAIRMIFQPELLAKPNLNQDGGPLKRALQYIIEISEIKAFIVAQCATQLHEFWSKHTDVTDQSMLLYANEITQLLMYGPLRDRDDQKFDASISLRLQSPQAIEEAQDSAAIVFSQNDYIVRVLMNDLMMRLDESRPAHVELGRQVLDGLLVHNLDEKYYISHYLNTIEHRERLRIWCAAMLLLRFISEENVDHYLELIHQAMRRETVVSVRCYVEWALMKLLAAFPSRLNMMYKLLENPDAKPHFLVSMLTILFPLGDILDDDAAREYFDEIFPRIVPWLTSNHFTVRLYAYCAWFRNIASCKRRGLNPDFDKNRFMASLISFVEQYADSIKFTEKIQSQFYLTKFDPIQDYNIEFIFRQMMTIFGVIDNEKISSRVFAKVNSEPIKGLPFSNPEREIKFNLADPTELFKEDTTEQPGENSDKDEEKQMSFQKKILPWQMMLETDVDLTKSLVQKKRRRNSLIVVASLIDRIPNLAGLCRTCEIFNAELLVVYSLKIKDDPQFASISVSSERWMPMAEVGEADVAAFLKAKKQEGYMLCGLEQTTTSAMLGEYEFPEKCVLLLGKERAGVPADLLQMLDQTIEIPQQGITRSLNVHVSGAIAIYEYSKQMQWRSI